MRALRIVGLAIAVSAMIAPGLLAQGNNERLKLTYMTFSAPVQVPGVTLPAGTYRFQMADIETGSAHAVQIFSQDGTKLYTTFLAIPAEMRDTPDKTVVMFAERPAGAPQAVKEWFYPGNSIGEEFVYPKSIAVQIAKANHTSVPAVEDENAKDEASLKTAKVGRVDENGNPVSEKKSNEVAENQKSSAPAATTTAPAATTTAPANENRTATAAPAATTTADANRSARANANRSSQSTATSVGTSGQAATPNANQNPTNTAQPNNTRRQLPRTASTLPMLGLFSLLALGAGLGVGQLRRRLA